MSRSEVHEIEILLTEYQKFREVFQMREATLQRFLREPLFDELLALHRADAAATDGNLAYYEFCTSRLKEVRSEVSAEAPKLVDGTDLIQLGLQARPGVFQYPTRDRGSRTRAQAQEQARGSGVRREELRQVIVSNFSSI